MNIAELPDDLLIYTGKSGTGQKVHGLAEAPPALTEAWLLDVPGWSPAWRHFMVSVITLKEIDGVGRATKRWPGATHELVVQAMDSEKLPLPTDKSTWSFLTPVNVVWQFSATDAEAAKACRALTALALDGGLCLETQGIEGAKEQWAQWIKRLLPNARIE
jgi:hypothetical protein